MVLAIAGCGVSRLEIQIQDTGSVDELNALRVDDAILNSAA